MNISVNDKINKMTVLKILEPVLEHGRYRVWVECKCDCGKTKIVRLYSLKSGQTQSCGCLRENVGERSLKHGFANTPLYKIYAGLLRRCYNPECDSYPNYGGRGITVCDEWKNDFTLFYTWALANGWRKGLELDRRENDGIYEPSNCRFVTSKINNRNRRDNIFITLDGKTLCIAEWAEITGILPRTISKRLSCGFTPDKVLLIGKHKPGTKQGTKNLSDIEEPNCCAFCGKPCRFIEDRFCSEDCENDFNEPSKPKTLGQVIRMDIEPNGDLYVAE